MPTDNSFSWLHLTDFHYGLSGQGCLWPNLRQPFLDDLAALHDQCGPWDAVLFTGDLVQSGQSAQFGKMQTDVLDPLWEKLGELGSGSAVLLAVPGNHDLYRPDPRLDDAAVDRLRRRVASRGKLDRYAAECNSALPGMATTRRQCCYVVECNPEVPGTRQRLVQLSAPGLPCR